MAMAKAAILAVVAALAAQLAAAADHPVGGDGSWDASGGGYDAWSAKQTFKQGDTLSFKFSTSHDVTEVAKAGYDACSGANPVKSYSGTSATVKLSAPGNRYFICSVPGHCAAGMKLEVTVAVAAVTAPAPARSKPWRQRRSVAPTPGRRLPWYHRSLLACRRPQTRHAHRLHAHGCAGQPSPEIVLCDEHSRVRGPGWLDACRQDGLWP